METGKIKFWNRTKAFGFIINNKTSEEVFVHISGLKDREYEPNQDEDVTYDIKEGKRGPNAVNVQPA